MNDILISGYYGFKNSGDDALLMAIVKDLKEQKEDIKLKVLSKNPKETKEIYNIKAVNRLNPFSVLFNIIGSKMLLSGGGTLIQDGTSTKSLLYYLGIISLANLFGKRIMLYANGIGPLSEENMALTGKILNKADIITLRDKDSLMELKKIGVTKPEIILTADPAFGLEFDDFKKGKELLKETGVDTDKKIACISVRSFKNMSDNFKTELAKLADYIKKEYGYQVVFMPMQYGIDNKISKEIMSLMTEDSYIIEKRMDIAQMLGCMDSFDICIGMRLHSLIYSVSRNVPVVGLVYDPKIKGFMDYIKEPLYMDAEKVSFEGMKEKIDECIKNESDIKARMSENLVWLQEKAKKNAEYAINLSNKQGGDKNGR